MIDRRQLLTWWRAKARDTASREVAPPLTRVVPPTPIDTSEPFSLERFYAAREGATSEGATSEGATSEGATSKERP